MRICLVITILLALSWYLWPQAAHAGTPVDSYTIERYNNEAENQQSTTSTTFQDAVTLTFTPPSTKDFLIVASALINNSSTSYYTEVQLTIDGATYAINTFTPYDTATNNYHAFAAHKVISLSGGSSHTLNIQYRSENLSGTAYIKNARIAALEVTNYNTQISEGVTTITATNQWQTIVPLNFSPASSTDYLILATADETGDGAGANKDTFVSLTYDGTNWGEIQREPIVNGEYTSYSMMRKLTGDGSAHSFVLQCKAQGTPDAYIKNARVTAVKLADLDSTGTAQYAESEAASPNTSATYSTKVSSTFTPAQRGDYLVIVSAIIYEKNNPNSVFAKLDIDGTEYGEMIYPQNCSDDWGSFFAIKKVNLSNASHTISVQWKSQLSGAQYEANIRNARILVLRLDTAESYNASGHTTVSNSFSAPYTTAYIWSHGLRASNTYAVGYYDGNGSLTATDSGLSSSAYGTLSSQYYLPTNRGAATGTWHAAVFDSQYGSPPSTYASAASAAGYVVEDSFTVFASAIPEFPTILAALAVIALCAGVYYWMRRKRLKFKEQNAKSKV